VAKDQVNDGSDGFLSDEEAAARDAAEAAKGELTTQEPRLFEMRGVAATDKVAAEELRTMSLEQLSAIFGITEASEAIGTDQYGPILEDKHKLVGVPMAIVRWDFYPGDFGEFVSAWVLTGSEDRYIVNDGSSGIYRQLRDLTNKDGQNAMLVCKHGLRVSKYDKELPNGQTIKDAETFYIDTKL